MEADEIKLSYYDQKRGIRLPKEITPEVAYFCGVMAGDGHIAGNRDKKHKYVLNCGGNPADEIEFYDVNIRKLMKRLFNIEPIMKHMSGGTYGFNFGSKSISNYLTGCIGLPSGRKPLDLSIPQIIEQNKTLKHHFIQGLVDTDFGFCLKKRYKEKYYYPVLACCFKGRTLTEEVYDSLSSKDLRTTNILKVKSKDDRVELGYTIRHRFEICGHLQLLKFVDIIKLRHPKHKQKFKLWVARNIDNKNLFKKI